MKNKKLIIIGLDGARLDIIEKWIKEGFLPNMKRMLKKGVSGHLKTVFPPHSMLAWTSFMTGKNPGKHGIYNTQLQIPGSYKLMVPNSTDIQAETIYEILSENGLFTGFINIPLTYPPKEINGVIISSWLSPPFTNYTYPKNVFKKLKEIGYKIQPKSLHKEEEDFIEELYETTEKRFETIKWFLKNHDWNLLAVLITGTEHMHHNFAAFIDKNHSDYSPEEEKIVRKYYEYVDEKIGELLEILGKTTNVLIISDHGFGPSYGEIYLNNLLKRYGYFKPKKRVNPLRYVFSFLETSGLANKLRGLLQIDIFRFLPKWVQNFIKRGRAEDIEADWRKTKAYCTGILGDIRINLKNREPEGIVERKDYKKVREEIIKIVSKDDSVSDLLEGVHKKEEIFNGPYLKEISDLYVRFKKCCTSSTKMPKGKIKGKRRDIGFHTMNGMLIAFGPDISKGKIENAKIIDIAPTVLHMMKLPVLNDMDGKVLKKIFRKNSELAKREIKFLEKKRRKKEKLVLSKRDEERVKERLRDLGYLS